MNRGTLFIATLACLIVCPTFGRAEPKSAKIPAAPERDFGRATSDAPKTPGPGLPSVPEKPTSPLETVIAFARALDHNDMKAARALSTGGADDDELLAALCAAAGASREMRDAAVERFGKAADALHQVSFADQVLYGREKVIADSKAATVILGDDPPAESAHAGDAPKTPARNSIGLVFVNDRWKVDLATLPQRAEPDAVARAKSRAHAAGSVAADLKSGEFPTIKEAGAAFEAKTEAAFEAESRLARLNAKARERGGDASSVPINRPNPSRPAADPKKDWIGKEASAGVRPTLTNESLADKTRVVKGDVRVTPLLTKEILDVRWSADGRFALILQKDGILRKVAVPGLVEERRVDLGAKPADVAICRTAICVSLPASDEICLLDPSTLDLKRRVTIPGIRRLTASAASTYVFVSTSEDSLAVINSVNGDTKFATAASLTGQAIQLYGIAAKKPARKGVSDDSSAVRVGFHLITASPDGTALYCADQLRIHRLRIRAGTVTYEESSPEVGSDAMELSVSADGQYVALPIGAGNLELPSSPRPPFATYVFRGAALTKPVVTIDAGPHPRAIAFDARAHAIYTQNDEHQLIVFSSQGELLKQFNVIPDARTATRILAHPDGNKLLVLIEEKAAWIELGAAGQ